MKKVNATWAIMRLLAIADEMEKNYWMNNKRSFPQYEQIRNEVNQVLQAYANKKLNGLDQEVEIP